MLYTGHLESFIVSRLKFIISTALSSSPKLPAQTKGDPRNITNHPSQADLFETRLQDGDILLVYTDGFGNNVWIKEVEELVERTTGKHGLQGDRLVESLADTAVSLARDYSHQVSLFIRQTYLHRLHYRKVARHVLLNTQTVSLISPTSNLHSKWKPNEIGSFTKVVK